MFLIFLLITLLTILLSVFGQNISAQGKSEEKLQSINAMGKFDKVRLNEKNYGLVRNLHSNWYAGGIKAIMGKMGRDLFRKLLPNEQKTMAECLDRIEDRRDLVQSAKCLTNLRRIYLLRIIGSSNGKKKIIKLSKREAKKRQSKKTKGENEMMEWKKRLGEKWKNKMDKKEANEKGKKSKWTMERPKLEEKFRIRQADSLENLAGKNDRSAIIRVSNLISKLANVNQSSNASGVKWSKMFNSLVRLKKANEKRMESPGAAVYEKRMFDLVMDRKEPSFGPKGKLSPEGIVRQGISLLQKLSNGTDQQQKEATNYKLMSPRIAPLMPDPSKASKSILSPTVFALYETAEDQQYGCNKSGTVGPQKEAKGVQIASVPEVLKATGLNQQDREALLQALMEMTGTIGHVQQAMELLKALNFFANDRILGAYTKMEKSFESAQKRELDEEGWTFIRRAQFDQLCRDQYAEFPYKVKAKMAEFDGLHKNEREEAVWKRIERIARNTPEEIADKVDKRRHEKIVRLHFSAKNRRRMKRQQPNGEISGLSVLKPVVLEPYMFTPIYGLSVLGPLILSPNIFSPVILAPSVFSPWVLSPAAPVPYILSPYVFGPFILSPMAMAPFIVLSPDILSPQILGGGILSPTVGSPAVLTESALMASVLSPSVLETKAINEIREKRNATDSENVAQIPTNCKTECETQSDGRNQKCTTKCQISVPFRMLSQQQIQIPNTQIISRMSETREFLQMDECVRFCQGKGIAKTAEECRKKCQPVPMPTGTEAQAKTEAIPQLTLNMPFVSKVTETHQFVGTLEDCIAFCQKKGIGKSVEECRGKCQPIGTTVVTQIVEPK
ncbi:hypothetical protein niasHS_015117 [Heterodera schachtii]|uniref:Uncharacterized protein n=1 Tax=Heterodera schachtii TaxID=97005 RepID=A0ABD2I260_HETSC